MLFTVVIFRQYDKFQEDWMQLDFCGHILPIGYKVSRISLPKPLITYDQG